MEVPQLTALQKAKQKYYASKKASISEAKKKAYAEKMQSLADDEIVKVRQIRQEKNAEKKSKMTPEEMAIKKQKQSEYKAKYDSEHKAYIAEREQEGYERALKRWEKDPIYNKKPVDILQKKKTRGPNKKPEPIEEEIEEPTTTPIILSLTEENVILSISEKPSSFQKDEAKGATLSPFDSTLQSGELSLKLPEECPIVSEETKELQKLEIDEISIQRENFFKGLENNYIELLEQVVVFSNPHLKQVINPEPSQPTTPEPYDADIFEPFTVINDASFESESTTTTDSEPEPPPPPQPKKGIKIKLKSKTYKPRPRMLSYVDSDGESDDEVFFEEMSEEELYCPPRDARHARQQREYKFKMAKYRKREQERKYHEMLMNAESEEDTF